MLLRTIYRRCYPILMKTRRAVLWPFALLFFASEQLVLLILHIPHIRRASHVCHRWVQGSFGHQALDLHMLGMRYAGRDFLVLFSDYGDLNHYLLDTFHGRVRVRFLEHSRIAEYCWRSVLGVPFALRVNAALLRFVHFFSPRTELVSEFYERHGSQIEGTFVTEYLSLLEDHPAPLLPPAEHIERFRRALAEGHPEISGQWFVALYLRRKQRGKTCVRDIDPAPYRALLACVRAEGGVVFCGGDYDPHDVFPGEEGVFGYGDFPCPRWFCDLAFLSQARFVVSTHSGPAPVATIFGTPVLIAECAFFYLSGFRGNQRVSYKKLVESRTGRVLNASEAFSFPIVGYSENREFARAGLQHVGHTEEEIGALAEEAVSQFIRGDSREPPDYAELERRFRALLPDRAWARVGPSRPAYAYLRSLQW